MRDSWPRKAGEGQKDSAWATPDFGAFLPPAVTEPLIARRAEFQRALRKWYQRHARPLPWRDSPSLYKTVVSEFMLQQTQVKTVLPYFARWLAALPDFPALATAPEEQVLKLWEGLGYYSRARNLHKLARAIVNFPAPPLTPVEWRELPGVGPYTAAAITSISFGEPAACVDGNVVRILARLTANGTELSDSASAAKVFAPLADSLLPATRPGDHNQAMMELGATVCLRHNPLCSTCPVRNFCAAAKRGEPEAYPRLARKKIEQRAVARIWCVQDNAVLLHRTSAAAKRLANLHELPSGENLGLDHAALTRGELVATRRRSITRFQITESIHRVKFSAAERRAFAGQPALHWVPLTELHRITLSGPHRRWINELLEQARP
jgi:A/G-specific adenine glycosylase